MKRPATWKVLTVGAAMTGLGVLGAGTAMADEPRPSPVDTSGEKTVEVLRPATDDGGASESESESRILWWYLNR